MSDDDGIHDMSLTPVELKKESPFEFMDQADKARGDAGTLVQRQRGDTCVDTPLSQK